MHDQSRLSRRDRADVRAHDAGALRVRHRRRRMQCDPALLGLHVRWDLPERARAELRRRDRMRQRHLLGRNVRIVAARITLRRKRRLLVGIVRGRRVRLRWGRTAE